MSKATAHHALPKLPAISLFDQCLGKATISRLNGSWMLVERTFGSSDSPKTSFETTG
ncbi:hypothetical protein SynRS9907_02456 [Synechococcus sp. RS9907]|nr:hypothetical protein SynRS9907_02456 [Synechococcus sp. RS9907]